MNQNIAVAGRSAVRTLIALPLKSETNAAVNAGRYADFACDFTRSKTRTATFWARFGNDAPATAAFRASRLD